jgi:hypothetical protein
MLLNRKETMPKAPGTEIQTFVFLNSFFYCRRRAGIRG